MFRSLWSRSFWASSNPSIAGQHDVENHEVEGARHCEVEPFWAVCREGRDMAFLLEASLQEGRHALAERVNDFETPAGCI